MFLRDNRQVHHKLFKTMANHYLFRSNNKFIFILGLLLLCIPLRAQVTYEVDENNVAAFVQDFEHTFGNVTTVSTTELSSFLHLFLDNGTDASCDSPSAEVGNYNDNTIQFNLSGSASTSYNVGYLNLRTEAKTVTTAGGNTHSFSLPDGLYLYVFQKQCNSSGNRVSPLSIIIHDKVIAIQVSDDVDCYCRKKTASAVLGTVIGIPEPQEFDLQIVHVSGVDEVIYEMHFEPAEDEDDLYYFNPYCHNLGVLEEGNDPPYLLSYNDSEAATISFSDLGDQIVFDLAPSYELKMIICKQKLSSPWFGLKSGNVADILIVQQGSWVGLKGDFELDSRHSIQLYNLMGQLLQQREFPAGVEIFDNLFEVSAYPSGLYLIRIEGGEVPWSGSFFK